MGFEEYNKNRRKIGGWTCPFCSKVFAVRSELRSHQKQEHNGQKNTVECKCQYCEKSFNRTCSKTLHERYCLQNPNKEIKLGHPHTEEAKQLISNGMKLAHKEGRTSSWIGRRKRSYAEQRAGGYVKAHFPEFYEEKCFKQKRGVYPQSDKLQKG